MHTGTVKFFNHKNKFGFIIDDETKKEYYVHIKDVIGDTINENDKVTFELMDAPKGPQCAQVKKTS